MLSDFSHVWLFAVLWTVPGSSVHGISQARILEWIAMLSSRGSSWPRDQTGVSCIAGRFLPSEPPGESRLFILIFYAYMVRIVWWSFTAEHISVTITQIKKQNSTVFLSSHHTPPVRVQAVNNLHYFSSILYMYLFVFIQCILFCVCLLLLTSRFVQYSHITEYITVYTFGL